MHLENQVGSSLEEKKPEEKIVLPENWKRALRIIEQTSLETEVPYAIIGSLGIAAACGIAWDTKGHPSEEEVDLDIFVMGDKKQREIFHSKIVEKTEEGMPLIDSKMIFGSHVVFESEGTFVEHKNLKVPVEERVFKTIRISLDGIDFPVINPQTYLALLKIYNRKYSQKMQVRVNSLVKKIRTKSTDFDLLSRDDLQPLVKLKHSFEVTHLMNQLRRKVAGLKSNDQAATVIDSFHTRFPKLWKILHKLSSHE